jgi:isopenicillin N synthase-like dioxygenase
MFSRITDWKLKATKHRVLDIGVERFSSPFFLEPKYSALIPTNLLNKEQEGEAEQFGILIMRKLRGYAEWKDFVMPSRGKEVASKESLTIL